MKALVLYFSATGNTSKVADRIFEGMQESGIEVIKKSISEAADVEYFDYDLICLGFPSIHWHVPSPVEKYLKDNFKKHQKEGRVIPGAPRNGKDILLFCTYCGTHTGVKEAVPAVKYAAQYFEHVGFSVVDEWYIVGEYVGNEPNNTLGRLGDVSGQPDESELARIKTASINLAERLKKEKADA
ncbi:MAG: flavodoxin family protein [Ruminococcus sp.]